jgi:Zn-dependent protease
VFLAEPQPSQYDLNFHFAGVPVRVHPLFWLFTAIMGSNGIQGSPSPGVSLLMWISAVFVSVLFHELGHSLAMRHYGSSSHIVLYSMGGLAVPHSARRRDVVSEVVISIAGPAAGFAFAGAIVAALIASGVEVKVRTGLPYIIAVIHAPLRPWNLNELVHDLLFVNIYWGIINLMPVFPLDGGQAARAILQHVNPGQGLRQSLILSIATGAIVAYLAFDGGQQYLALMFGFLAFNNYQMLQSFSGNGRWQ